MTQAEISLKLNVTQQFVSHWIKGKRGVHIKTAKRWAEILNVEWYEIMDAPVEKRATILGIKNKTKNNSHQ